MADSRIEALRRVRDDYQVELDAHRFLLEAYSGTGGFSPSLAAPPASWWGAAATDYANDTLWSRTSTSPTSRLDRFPREDDKKFAGRIAVAHYENYVEPLTDLKCSYVLREPFAIHDEPEQVAEWKKNVDGDETTWADWLPDVVTQAATLGWTPLLLDSPPVAEGLSRAQAGDVRPTMSVLFPSQLLEWQAKGKRYEWVKIRTDHVERSSWSSAPTKIERYAIWTPTDVTVYRIVKVADRDEVLEGPEAFTHQFGRVPLVIMRHGSGGDPLRGRPMHWSVAQENKRLFNLLSELDEHTRANVFALLLYPGGRSGPNGEVDLGSFNGLLIDPDQKNVPAYIAPPASVAETLEKRIDATARSIYRIARIEFSRPTGTVASGVAREYEFEQTNRALADFAKNIARAELDIADLVGAADGVPVETRRKQTISPPRSFAVQDLERDIKIAMDSLTLKLGETATTRIKQGVVRRVLPNISADDQKVIDAELEEAASEEAAARAMGLEALARTAEPGDTPPGEGGEDDDAVTDPKKPAVPPAPGGST